MNACGVGVLVYHSEMMYYLYDVNNYIERSSINNRLPYGVFWGETPEISTIHFKLWEPVYFINWTNKPGKVLIHHGRFVWFDCNVGNQMTFKVLQ